MSTQQTQGPRKEKEVVEARYIYHLPCSRLHALDVKVWIILIGTKACEKVVKIITSPYLRSDVKKLSPAVQTSSVEAFHSVVNHFAPKMLSFTYEGMTCRLVS